MKNSPLNAFGIGLRRDWLTMLLCAYIAYTVLWAILDPIVTLTQLPCLTGVSRYVIMAVVSLLLGVAYGWPKSQVSIPMRNINTKVTVVFGDLFQQHGCRVISVNEFFDSEIGDPVSPRSLHGVFIQNVLGGQAAAFDKLVNENLDGKASTHIQRPRGKQRRYEIGTTAVVDIVGVRYFLVALCRTNLETLKAEAGVPELWQALSGLWDTVRVNANGETVSLPLLGSGLAQMRLPPKQLIQIILMSILEKAKSEEIASEIRLVLTPDKFAEVDLNALRKEWS